MGQISTFPIFGNGKPGRITQSGIRCGVVISQSRSTCRPFSVLRHQRLCCIVDSKPGESVSLNIVGFFCFVFLACSCCHFWILSNNIDMPSCCVYACPKLLTQWAWDLRWACLMGDGRWGNCCSRSTGTSWAPLVAYRSWAPDPNERRETSLRKTCRPARPLLGPEPLRHKTNSIKDCLESRPQSLQVCTKGQKKKYGAVIIHSLW